MQIFERGKFTARARTIGYNLLRRGVAAKELAPQAKRAVLLELDLARGRVRHCIR